MCTFFADDLQRAGEVRAQPRRGRRQSLRQHGQPHRQRRELESHLVVVPLAKEVT